MQAKIAKFIADSGHCSRRVAEKLINDGKVLVNGKIPNIAMRVSETDEVVINGKKINNKKRLIYIALNKPTDYVCTTRRDLNEKNIFSLINIKERLFIAGRLDKNSRGLVILTNDGNFAYKLTHPSFVTEKEYMVEINKEINQEILEKLKDGVNIFEKSLAKMKDVKKIGHKKYKIILTEGKKRQIRRMFKVFKVDVVDLQRTRTDKYNINKIEEGCWAFIKK